MTRSTLALATALVAVLLGTAAIATAAGDAPTTIDACRDIRHGLVRIVFDENACKKNEAHISWDAQGPQGPAGPAGAAGGGPACAGDLQPGPCPAVAAG